MHHNIVCDSPPVIALRREKPVYQQITMALIGLVERQIAGQPVEPIRVPFGFKKSFAGETRQPCRIGNLTLRV